MSNISIAQWTLIVQMPFITCLCDTVSDFITHWLWCLDYRLVLAKIHRYPQGHMAKKLHDLVKIQNSKNPLPRSNRMQSWVNMMTHGQFFLSTWVYFIPSCVLEIIHVILNFLEVSWKHYCFCYLCAWSKVS